MSQSTLVVVVPPAQRAPLRERLSREAFEFRTVPHALFSVKGPEVVATLYQSGKLVIQGRDPELFAERFLDGGFQGPPKESEREEPTTFLCPLVGSDECGKGDYFGPLVVCAVRFEPEDAAHIAQSGATDSKKLTDPAALRIAAALRGLAQHSVRRLDPPEYNRLHGRDGALNELLASLHIEAIREIAQAGDRVLVDQFSKKDLIGPALQDLGVTFEERPRAESDPAVAAASVIARSEFLIAMQELSEEWTVELRKGAGPPVDQAGAAFVRLHGRDRLGEVAKLHFKNTAKVEALLRGQR